MFSCISDYRFQKVLHANEHDRAFGLAQKQACAVPGKGISQKSKQGNLNKKTLQTCKPDSVPRAPRRERGASAIYLGRNLAARLCAAYPPCQPEGRCASHASPDRSPGAGHKVYMAFQPARFIRVPICTGKPCALTARFHPYPEKSGRLFSATLSVPWPLPRPHPLGGAVLCVVRTFLPSLSGKGGRAVCSVFFKNGSSRERRFGVGTIFYFGSGHGATFVLVLLHAKGGSLLAVAIPRYRKLCNLERAPAAGHILHIL